MRTVAARSPRSRPQAAAGSRPPAGMSVDVAGEDTASVSLFGLWQTKDYVARPAVDV